MAFIEATPALYEQIRELGVPARVWDEVLEVMRSTRSDYDEGYHSMTPPAFDEITFDLRFGKRLDFARNPDVSDHDYVGSLLKQSDAVRMEQLKQAAYLRAQSGLDAGRATEDEDDWHESERTGSEPSLTD